MAATSFLCTLVCVLGIISFATCQTISCYDCDPRNFVEDCADPKASNARSTPCVPDVDVQNGTAICLSAFLKFSGEKVNETGIYRGCKTLRPDVSNFCDWFVEENKSENLTIPTCKACNETRCNTARFKDDGSSGAQSLTATIFVLAVNAIFLLIIRVFE